MPMVEAFSFRHELLKCGQSVEIDGIGKFEKLPLFPNGLNHKNNIALFKSAKCNMIYFRASDELIQSVT